MLRMFSATVFLAGVAIVAGCGDSSGGRVAISGTVKLKNEPIKDGAIVLFEPLDNQDSSGNVTVTNGAFSIPKENGLKPGKYLVRITAGDGKTAVNPLDPESPPGPGGTNIISKELVPKEWNVNSKQEVTVTTDGPNKFEFNIP